ncbi:TetR/AcrR family transcriptional regulator [Amycolatopsis magusensis]|uniref:AcrR family transcriptional regulator n=1 Tax=Amycolatopsis magusensis TaxID=882444 RepID=A0ABS4Q0S6_9PSEU|nr:TetR/AcrR family transcriptional regulator [Amycolatopsis magusensis]MBP2184718.1 AcrR family transcriptional regulator [Amycolatopsis magusensis]
MGRWKPNARERLERAAMELFVQRGYESTTVAEIAERAGLTKSTFFRHFSDKREVLFGRDELRRLFADAITGAPAAASPIEAVVAVFDALAPTFGPERRAWGKQRQAVIAGNSELRERELLKLASLAEAMTGALRDRGVPDPAASLAAELGGLAFRNAYARWVELPADEDFAVVAREELDALKSAMTALG